MKIKNVRRDFFRKKNNITCVLTYDLGFVNNIETTLFYANPKIKLSTQNFKAVGRAKCNPEDTFDETTGRKIALSRAHRQMFRDVINFIEKIVGDSFDRLDDIVFLKEKYEIALMRQKQYRNNLNQSRICQSRKK